MAECWTNDKLISLLSPVGVSTIIQIDERSRYRGCIIHTKNQEDDNVFEEEMFFAMTLTGGTEPIS